MAEKDSAPPAGQDGQDPDGGGTVQPFPRSPRLQRKAAAVARPSQEQLSRCLEELQEERCKTEAHVQSLKKRRADLSRRTDAMKQHVHESFDNMRAALRRDEQAVMDSLELDLKRTRTQLDQVLRSWRQHQDQVGRSITRIQRVLSGEGDGRGNASPKRPDASEKEIRLDEERFEKLLRSLSSVSKSLTAQLQRKTLLLDFSPMVIDRRTCHGDITVTSEGRAMSFTGAAAVSSAPERPLQFDKVRCALGSAAVGTGHTYWEVDVHCSSVWAVGVTYGSLQRKGRDKGAKLGRNRNSWCVELRDGSLRAWHNDRHVACDGMAPPRTVGVSVDHPKGQLVFYDADTMSVLQRFSAAVAPVFDRAHHQFTEALYPAVRFPRPPEGQTWPNHLELLRFPCL